jgi:hypothetical protein
MDRSHGPPVPGREAETRGNGPLNTPDNPSWERGGQFLLGQPDAQIREGASLLAAAVHQAQRDSDFTLGSVGMLAGTDTPYVSKVFDMSEPHKALRMLVAVLRLDGSRTTLRRLNAMCNCGLVELRQIPDDEFRRRIEAWARQSKAHRAQLEEALAEEP